MKEPREEFSVCQFFKDNAGHDYVCRFVGPDQAMKIFGETIRSVGAQIGITVRVIVTDGGDNTNVEWKFGEGITYPPEIVEMLKKMKRVND